MIFCGQALAEEPAIKIDNVVVTATRTDSTTDKIGGTSVTVLTKEDIAAQQQTSVKDVLKEVPGLDVVENGGPGTTANIFLRGADAKNTLILVDGVMFNDPSSTDRSANLANLTTDNIERIEVVRGPMSVLYGSNATAGVINIITKKGTGTPKSSFEVEGGSYNTWKEYGASSGSIDRFSYSVNLSHTGSDGFSVADNRNSLIPHAGNTSEKDGWENTSFSGRAGFQIRPAFEIAATLRAMQSTVDLDDFGPGYTGDRFSSWPYTAEPDRKKRKHTDSEQYLGRLDVNNTFFDGFLKSNFYYQLSHHNRTGYDNDGIRSYDYLGENQETGWQGTLALSTTNDLTLGTSFYQEDMKSESSGINEKTVDTKSVWGQEQLSFFDSLDLAAGLRYDNHDRFGGKTTFRIAPSYLIGSGTTLKASYGTGFRAPSLFELYSIYGNVNLQPEKSRGWDLGLEQRLSKDTIVCGLTYFALNFENRIAYDFLTNTYQQASGKTRTNGVETFVRWNPTPNLLLQANYTYTNTEDPAGNPLARRPRNKIGIQARYRYGKARFNTDVKWVGKRYENAGAMDLNGNPVTSLDPYTVVNLAVSYDLTETVQLYGRIDNLFDEYYEEAWSYATPGRAAYVGVKVSL